MINYTHLKADCKQVSRDPALVMFMLLPSFIFIIFRLVVVFLFPYIYELTGYDILGCGGFVLAFAFLVTPLMIGAATGFLMIDERDNRIFELMAVTPAGRSGYIANRLLMPFVMGVLYTIAGYFILCVSGVSLPMLIYIAVLVGFEGIMTGLLLFGLAEDKVKGLAYSKAMGAFMVFGMADLLGVKWVSVISSFFPHYWISRLVNNPAGILPVLLSALVHLMWLCLAVSAYVYGIHRS